MQRKIGCKRVLMLLENCGYPRDDRVRREARALTSANYHVTVICPKYNEQVCYEDIEGVCVYRFPEPYHGQGFLGYLWEYAYTMIAIGFLSLIVFIKDGFDILHAHHPPDTFVFIAAFYKLLGKKYILDHHDLAPELYYARFGGKGHKIIYDSLVSIEKIACRLADHVIATNQSYKAIEMQRDHVPEQHISIVRNGPDLNELHNSNVNPFREKDGKILIGYVGVMGTQDGVDYLLRALNCLKTDLGRKDFLCILVGNGDTLPGLKCLAHQLKLDDYVNFTGWVDSQSEVARYLSAFDICIAPEPSDNYNDRSTAAKIMEYMALGKPIVSFDLPEHRFSAHEAAIYARPNDELDMALKISTLMDDPDLRQAMGEKGKERILNDLAWHHQAKALLQAYDGFFTNNHHYD